MNLKTVWAIFRKEILETLRDRRALMAMIGIPVILYPALFIVITQASIVQQTNLEAKPSRVAVGVSSDHPLWLWLAAEPKLLLVDSADPNQDLALGNIQAYVEPNSDVQAALEHNDTAYVVIKFDSTEIESTKALNRIRGTLMDKGHDILAQRLEDQGLQKEFVQPLYLQETNVATPEKTTGSALGMVLPVLLIIMMAVGAMYPALDLTAGEKERGTFETLLSTPAGKSDIVWGKFLTVVVLSLTTGLLNLASMAITLVVQLQQIAKQAGSNGGGDIAGINLSAFQVTPQLIGSIVLIMIPLSFFICATMMAIALFARSFKEAQNYVTPFYILIVLPGMFAGMPGIELTEKTLFIPITNVALLFKGMLTGKAGIEDVFGVFLCITVYAVLALVGAVGLFQREEVILSEQKGLPISLNRKSIKPRSLPTPGLSLCFFALACLLVFYVGTSLQAWKVLPGVFYTEWLLLFAPVVAILWYLKIDPKQSLHLHTPRLGGWLAAILLAGGAMVWVAQVRLWQNQFLPMPEQLQHAMLDLFQTGGSLRQFLYIFLIVAVSPAICEEILFRGAILSGFRKHLPEWVCVVLVAVLFSVFHLSVFSLIHTALLGALITYLALRSGSIFPAMLMHLINNGMMVCLATGVLPEPVMQALNLEQWEQTGVPILMLVVATASLAAGVLVAETVGRKQIPESQCEIIV